VEFASGSASFSLVRAAKASFLKQELSGPSCPRRAARKGSEGMRPVTRFLSILLFPAALAASTLTFPSPTGGDAVLSYRKAGETEWHPGFGPVYDSVNHEYRGSIVRLHENTRYDVRLDMTAADGSRARATGTLLTWSSEPTVASVRKLSSFRRGDAYEISGLKGAPDGWIRIVGDVAVNAGGTSDAVITFEECQYIILERATVTGGRLHGIMINASCSDVRIVNCDISQWGRIPVAQKPDGEYRDAADNSINHDAGV
jgi:hypothetical protein